MRLVTLYRVVAEQVELGDSFAVSRSPGLAGQPVHFVGNGDALVGVHQMHPHAIQPCLGAAGEVGYIALAPELRALLEAPIRAEAAQEIARQRAELLAAMRAGPWWARVWRALDIQWPPRLARLRMTM